MCYIYNFLFIIIFIIIYLNDSYYISTWVQVVKKKVLLGSLVIKGL